MTMAARAYSWFRSALARMRRSLEAVVRPAVEALAVAYPFVAPAFVSFEIDATRSDSVGAAAEAVTAVQDDVEVQSTVAAESGAHNASTFTSTATLVMASITVDAETTVGEGSLAVSESALDDSSSAVIVVSHDVSECSGAAAVAANSSAMSGTEAAGDVADLSAAARNPPGLELCVPARYGSVGSGATADTLVLASPTADTDTAVGTGTATAEADQSEQAVLSVSNNDSPYNEAVAKLKDMSARMEAIGSPDVKHPDPAIQKQLRKEYYLLEKEMEQCVTAMMQTDEFAAKEAREDRQWEEANYVANLKALKAIRRTMPVEVKSMSEAQLRTAESPSGKTVPAEIARKFKRTNILELLRCNPSDIAKTSPVVLENLRDMGLSATERRALHVHLRDTAETWKAQQGSALAVRKYEWFRALKATFKSVVNSYDTHVEQYGPIGDHPYASRDAPDVGCPMLGKQCPLKADQTPAYDVDLGWPDSDVYVTSSVVKGSPYDAGAQAMAEVRALIQEMQRADALQA
ncbi:hypothetical protein BBJ28_00026824 [Nothophytophthora sp. Chile5]|nr:hypothetical protein BBJ28_00026824 [Nothophytophthora sp. Chile5]